LAKRATCPLSAANSGREGQCPIQFILAAKEWSWRPSLKYESKISPHGLDLPIFHQETKKPVKFTLPRLWQC